MEKVKINPAKKAEVISVKLTKEKTPIAYNKKLNELMEQGAFKTVTEAEAWLENTEYDLELYYQKDCGLFALDPEALACSTCYSPYTGDEMIPCDDDDKDDSELVVEALGKIYGAMKVLGSGYVCTLTTKTYSEQGFYLSRIDRYEKGNDCMYYQFWFYNIDGDYATVEINFKGEYAFGLSDVAKDNLRKVFGWESVEEGYVTIFVRNCLSEEINRKMFELEKSLQQL